MKTKITLGLIVLIAIFWRFVDYGNRWVLNQDQARDASIARYALQNQVWPEIGSPSSAGPFNFGPWYHWLIIGMEKILPGINGPWVGFTILSVVSVVLYSLAGRKIGGNLGMVTAGLMAAVATGQVENAPDMLNTVIVGFTGALTWWATAKLVTEEKWRWGVVVGMGVGWSINCHFQAWGLMSLPLAIMIVNKYSLIKRIKLGMGMGIGWLITFLPMLWFDINHKWIWIQSVIEYYTVGVKRFYVPVRWLTEIRDFWPQLAGSVTVGIPYWGYVMVGLGIGAVIVMIKRRGKIDKFWIILAVSWLIQILLMRNYRGVRSREYLIVFHGYIILAMSWIMTELFRWRKMVVAGVLVVTVALASVSNWKLIENQPSQAKLVLGLKTELDKVVGNKVAVYNYRESNMIAMPMFYLWYRENRIDQNGFKVGFCDANRYVDCPMGEATMVKNYKVYGLENTEGFAELTPEGVYKILVVNYGKD